MKIRLTGALCAAAVAAGALGAAVASAVPVTFRVEGPSSTLVPQSGVDTIAGSFTHDGNPSHTCPYRSAGGVLELGTAGNWTGSYDTGLGDYFIKTIKGVSPGSNQYWTLWYNHTPAQSGACGQAVNSGDDVLYFVDCYGMNCPHAGNGYAVLGESVPASAQAGAPVTVSVTSYDAASGAPTPAVGATVSAGQVSATTDSQGRATLTFPTSGSVTVQATAADSIRSETHSLCVHNGSDGLCGTTAPAAPANPSQANPVGVVPSQGPAPQGAGSVATGEGAIPLSLAAPRLLGLVNHRRHRRGRAPRVLRGTVDTRSPLRGVQLELTRRTGRACSYYSACVERFVGARCNGGRFFAVGSSSVFSYLLPAVLGHGHYVLEAKAVDAAGKSHFSAPVSFDVRR